MPFPSSNLSTASQPWGREVEKQITTLSTTVKSNEINNAARDTQLSSALNSLQKIVSTIYVPGTEQIDGAALAAATLDGATVVDGTLPAGKIQANTITADQIATNYVYAGTINASQINAGTLTGFTIQTAASGRRVKIGGTTATFYDESGNYSGTITVAGSANEAIMTVNGPFTSRSISFSSVNTYISGGGGTYINLDDEPRITLGGNTTISGTLDVGAVSSGSISCGTVSSSGTLNSVGQLVCSGGSFNGTALVVDTGYLRCLDTYNRHTTGGLAVSVASNGTYFTVSSSRRFKQDIADYSVQADKFLAMRPVSFRYKQEVEEVGDQAGTAVGFIAEELEDLGLTEYVVYGEDGSPYGVNYTQMVVGIKQILSTQDSLIKSLVSRIEALEAK